MRFIRSLPALFAALAVALLTVAPAPASASQSTTISVTIQGNQTVAVNGYNATLPLSYGKSFPLANGSGSDQATTVYAVSGATIAASGSTTYDLAGGITDFTGATIALTKVRAIWLYAYPGNTNSVNIFGNGANGFVGCLGSTADLVKVPPGGGFLLVARDSSGCAVTAATGDILKVANGGAGTSVSFDLVAIGI